MATTWTPTINKVEIFGHRKVMDVSFVAAAASTYTTGGDSISGASVGLDVIDLMVPVCDPSAGSITNGAVLAWNSANKTLQLFVSPATPTAALLFVEFTGGTSTVGFGFRALVYGVA